MSNHIKKTPVNEMELYESKHNEKDIVNNHYHTTHQILYVLDGKGKCTMDSEDYLLESDNVAIVPPFTNHSIVSDSKMTVLVLEFNESFLSDEVKKELLPLVFDTSRVLKMSLFDSSELRQLLRKMLYEQSHGDTLRFLAMKLFLAELLFVLIRSYQTNQISDTNMLRVEWLRNYINTHYFEISGSEDIAKKMGMSTRYIHSIFKEHYGKTPMQHLTEVRLELVKKMLIETDNDIASICFEVGFESVSTFYRVFKKYVGVPPNQYRTSHIETGFSEEDE
ncbi:AraC-like DNA-binding protein/quercetin dioxygenase-like cupin family protein [Salibacterium salarium]|uniref:AraC family transcriptional regulator n=1 Tax=Salibacterium salarium TaxID=284579 RepID=UPI00277D487B|nr:AraC family transcriptional regulator [Salibacterium salarium]MDQ0300117.1 AraC-like DNA-binding protein/quercetin dioxygenase-like cupin family protein [Salibacterium salarium]